jgi:hypothetical protein
MIGAVTTRAACIAMTTTVDAMNKLEATTILLPRIATGDHTTLDHRTETITAGVALAVLAWTAADRATPSYWKGCLARSMQLRSVLFEEFKEHAEGENNRT